MQVGVKLGLSVAFFAAAFGLAACDDGGGAEASAGAAGAPAGGAGNAGGSSSPGGAGVGPTLGGASGGAGAPAGEGVPITMTGGWATNVELGIQGAVFPYSDKYSGTGMTSNLADPVDASVVNACIKGTAALVDQASTPCTSMVFTPPATDCFGEYWGAAIGVNLNQPIDPDTGKGVVIPLPYDASTLQGFTFEISGATVPAPSALRFKVEADTGEFCTPTTVKILNGSNKVFFNQLLDKCYSISTNPPNPTAETVQSKLLKISWQVVTNDKSAVPFDFCVSNVRALPK